MWIFFVAAILLPGGEPEMAFLGPAIGVPRQFDTKAKCESMGAQMFVRFQFENQEAEIMEHGCAKLKVKWGA